MTSSNIDMTRRSLVCLGMTALFFSAAGPAMASTPRMKGMRALAFHNLHTDERLRVTYWKDGKYLPEAHASINHLLRDHYSGDIHNMDIRLMDLLHGLQSKIGNDGALEVISGYRSPRTNFKLARYSNGVATQSYHTRGMAIDVRLPGTSLNKLHNVALALRRGGVGYYPESQFVHIDVGPVRKW
ncbi:MAG: DUF882 domain-containing protein [Bdellovibrionales bacterium]